MIVTADHECSDLQYNGQSKAQITKDLYSSKDHTKQNVAYYITTKFKADYYDALVEVLLGKVEVYDNTDIFKICKTLLKL